MVTNGSKRNSRESRATPSAHERKTSQYTVNCEGKDNVLRQGVKRARERGAHFAKALLYACVSTRHDDRDNTFPIQSEDVGADNESRSG